MAKAQASCERNVHMKNTRSHVRVKVAETQPETCLSEEVLLQNSAAPNWPTHAIKNNMWMSYKWLLAWASWVHRQTSGAPLACFATGASEEGFLARCREGVLLRALGDSLGVGSCGGSSCSLVFKGGTACVRILRFFKSCVGGGARALLGVTWLAFGAAALATAA